MVKQLIGNHELGSFDVVRCDLGPLLQALFALEHDFASLYAPCSNLSQNQLTNASVLSLVATRRNTQN